MTVKNVAKLIKKDFILAMHPTVPLMLLTAAMVSIPNYPYTVSFFYVTMGLFFTCLLGRENRDIAYSLSLPVAKRDIVTARISFAALIELISLALTAAAVLIVPYHANAAGMDPNLALIGWGFITYGVFNLVFFMMYYGNVNRVGVSFAVSSAAVFFITALDIVTTYAAPLFRDILDTPDPDFIGKKLLFTGAGGAFYIISFIVTRAVSVKKFEKLDLG